MKRFTLAVLCAAVLAAGWLHAQTTAAKTLGIYVPDTEGGKIALFVTPAGQTAHPAAAAAAPADPAGVAGQGAPGAGGNGGRGTPPPPHTPAHWIKISAQAHGTFTVTNTRNGFIKTYTK